MNITEQWHTENAPEIPPSPLSPDLDERDPHGRFIQNEDVLAAAVVAQAAKDMVTFAKVAYGKRAQKTYKMRDDYAEALREYKSARNFMKSKSFTDWSSLSGRDLIKQCEAIIMHDLRLPQMPELPAVRQETEADKKARKRDELARLMKRPELVEKLNAVKRDMDEGMAIRDAVEKSGIQMSAPRVIGYLRLLGLVPEYKPSGERRRRSEPYPSGYTQSAVAKILHTANRTIKKMVARGELEAVRCGNRVFIPESEVKRLKEQRRNENAKEQDART